MADPNSIKLGPEGDVQELSAFGRKYGTRWEDGLTRDDRAASGKLRRDTIARKRNFTLSWETVDQIPVDRINNIFETVDDELTLEVTHMLETKEYQVLLSPFGQERLLAVWDGLWEGFSLEFREV